MPGGLYWLASYPKSGNTWFRSFLHNLVTEAEVPADINTLATDAIASSRGWMDEVLGFDSADLSAEEMDRLRPDIYAWTARETQAPSYHKVHDAWRVLPDGRALLDAQATRGAVYLLRNPLDVAVSLANHNAIDIDTAITEMNDSAHALARNRRGLPGQVRQIMGSWSDHVTSWADAPDLDCHLLRYEDMQEDPQRVFTAAARFLGLPDAPDRIAKAIRFSRFDTLARQEAEQGFRERPAKVRRFFREGRSGGWRRHLTPDQVDRIVTAHAATMRRFGYLDESAGPV